MDNPFKKIDQPPKEVPVDLKKKVMDDASAFILFTEVATLFSSNYTEAVESFFKSRKDKKGNT